jgi:hypothetical protein
VLVQQIVNYRRLKMKVDIQDVLFWMDAIRNSKDRYRTLESFWKGQVNSKVWLIENLETILDAYPKKIVIHGGWNGVLSSLLFNSEILQISHITSVDIDPNCQEIASTINKHQEMEGRFVSVTADMTEYEYEADVVINTSCEHLTNGAYRRWLNLVPNNALIVLQSNNYFDLEEHINCAADLDDFKRMSGISILWTGEYPTEKYTRYMIIGKKNV